MRKESPRVHLTFRNVPFRQERRPSLHETHIHQPSRAACSLVIFAKPTLHDLHDD